LQHFDEQVIIPVEFFSFFAELNHEDGIKCALTLTLFLHDLGKNYVTGTVDLLIIDYIDMSSMTALSGATH